MQPSNWIPVFVRILLPFLAVVASQLVPVPSKVYSSFHISQLARQGSRPDKAAESLRKVLEREPWRSDLWEQIGILEQAYGNWEAAEEAFHKALSLGNISIEALTALGDITYQLERYDDALAIWEGLLGSSARNEELFRRVFMLQGEMFRADDQVRTLQAWLNYQPENPEVLYWSGLFRSYQDMDQAIEYLSNAKTIDPSYADKVDGLIAALDSIKPDQPASLQKLEIGRILAGIGHWEVAYEAFSEAIQLEPGYAEAWAYLAEAQQQLGQGGAEALERARSLSPDSVIVKALTAIYWRRQNQPDKAIENLEQIVELEPGEGIWKVELGYAVAQLGDIHQALTYLLEARRTAPENPVFLREIIRFCVHHNIELRTIALPAARAYLLLENESSQSLDMMALVMMVLEDDVSALRYLKNAIEKDPLNASAQLHLGQVYLSAYEMEQAYVHLSLASQLVSDTPQVSAAAVRLLERYFPDRIHLALESDTD